MKEVAHGAPAGIDELATVGRDAARGGYSRHLWQPADLEAREWFIARAEVAGLSVETDRNANIWAWWGDSGRDAVITGSHLDSVPGGGAYDGPLGLVSALDAVARLRESGFEPTRPFAVVAFAEEEGSRFGLACIGSGLMNGTLDANRVRNLRDRDGVSLADAGRAVGFDVRWMGPDPERLAQVALFVELHVEQGRKLIDIGAPVAVASSVLAHGRWRMTFRGEGNHAGSTTMGDRDDPMIAAAEAVLAVRDAALSSPGSRATVGRIQPVPGGTNVIASSVEVWLDARAEREQQAREVVDLIMRTARPSAVVEESWSDAVVFDAVLRDRIIARLGDVPVLATGAGHDSAVLAADIPTAMLFVRNPTGVSHAPEEYAELADCLRGTDALESVLRGVL